jgi:uncharacterized OsmC-like protein
MHTLNTFLERKSGVLAQRQQEMTEEPARGVVRLKVQSWVAGYAGARPVRMGESVWVSDSAPGLGGNALGPSAPELLLGALASCLVHTYLIVAALHAIPVEGVSVDAQGELDMRAVVGLPSETLPVMKRLTYQATVQTGAGDEAVARMHAEVERLCPVLNTLRLPVEVRRTDGAAS